MGNLKLWFRGIRGKLLLLIALPTVLLSFATYFSISSSRKLGGTIELMTNERIPISTLVGDLRASNHGTLRYLWLALNSEANDKRVTHVEEARERVTNLRTSTLALSKLDLTPEARKSFSTVPGLIVEMEGEFDDIAGLIKQNTPEANVRVRHLMINEIGPTSRKVVDLLQKIEAAEAKQNQELKAEAEPRPTKFSPSS